MQTPTFGKYQILAELGRGGMADVFLAMVAGPAGSGFSKVSVVKRLRENLAEDPEFIAMFMDEARISARLNHPNVVQTHEVGEEGGKYFLAMEFLDGQPLHRIQRRASVNGGRLARDRELLVVRDVLAGLHHAHELRDYDGTPLNIVHRDVTPQNVFVTYTGHVKVVDFGIAKAAGRAVETRQGVVKGKVRYMPPEQAMGLPLDRRADIFSAGILLWEALVGRRFWDRSLDDIDIARALISGSYERSARAVDPSVPENLDAICRKALAPSPDDRFATAEEFYDHLDEYLSKLDTDGMRRELGAEVGQLFAKERGILREVLERSGKLATLRAVDTLAFARTSTPISLPSSVRPLVVDVGPLSETMPVAPPAPSSSAVEAHTAVNFGRPRRSLMAVVAAVSLVVVAGLGGLVATRSGAAKATSATVAARAASPEPAQVLPPPSTDSTTASTTAFTTASPTAKATSTTTPSVSPAAAQVKGAAAPRPRSAPRPAPKKPVASTSQPAAATTATGDGPAPAAPPTPKGDALDSSDPWAGMAPKAKPAKAPLEGSSDPWK